MILEINNLFGIDALDAEFDDNTVTLVTGPNGVGKTSLAISLAAVASRTANPLSLGVASKKAYLKDGTHNGSAALTGCGTWCPVTGIEVPSEESEAPTTPQAAGLVDFCQRRTEKERAKLFEEFCLPADASEVLRGKWPDAAPQLDSVAEVINRDGWDSAMKLFEAQRLAAKREWQRITGAGVYSASKATTWTAPHWTHALAGLTAEEAQVRVEDARDALAALGTEIAVNEHERAKGIEARDVHMPRMEKQIAAHQGKIAETRAKLQAAEDRAAAATKEAVLTMRKLDWAQRQLDDTPDAECPYCEGALKIDGRHLEKWEQLSEAAMKEAQMRVETSADQLEVLSVEEKSQLNAVNEAREFLRNLESAAASMKAKMALYRTQAAIADRPVGEDDAHARARAAEGLREAQQQLKAMQQMAEATEAHGAVVELDAVCKLLGPKGARAELLTEATRAISRRLANICEVAGWPELHMTPAYDITCRGRPIQLCSESERLVCQYACLLYTSPSPRDRQKSRMPSSA